MRRHVEYLTNRGKEEDPAWVKKEIERSNSSLRVNSLVSRLEEIGLKLDAVTPVRDILKAIDFEEMEKIFFEEAKRAGMEVGPDEKIKYESIFFDSLAASLAGVNALTRQLEINDYAIMAKAERFNINLSAFVLFVICHEFVHIFSKRTVKGWRELNKDIGPGFINFFRKVYDDWSPPILEIDVGFQRSTNRTQTSLPETAEYMLFNEGVANKMALEVLLKYVHRCPGLVSIKDAEIFLSIFGQEPKESLKQGEIDFRASFKKEIAGIEFVERIIKTISKKQGVNEEMVWNAVKRANMGDGNFHNKETQKGFEKMFPGLLKELRGAVNLQEVADKHLKKN